MQAEKQLKVLGIMSGTSLDGLDLALCQLSKYMNKWSATFIKTDTIAYDNNWIKKLQNAPQLTGRALLHLHSEYGNLIGRYSKEFLTGHSCDLIASHGHTIFHEPDKNMTFQLGHGANIAAKSGRNTIVDFRTTDVALGGNGAPLVPIGDRLLFSAYTACINLGGFINISYPKSKLAPAFDICPMNIVLNHYARQLTPNFDKNGIHSKKGEINHAVLATLNTLPYYQTSGAKSLGLEWVEAHVYPLLNNLNVFDAMATFLAHALAQVNMLLKKIDGKILLSGGGTFHKSFVTMLKQNNPHLTIVIPDPEIIAYKEALIFGLLGALHINGESNVLGNTTGSGCNHIGGAFYHGVEQANN